MNGSKEIVLSPSVKNKKEYIWLKIQYDLAMSTVKFERGLSLPTVNRLYVFLSLRLLDNSRLFGYCFVLRSRQGNRRYFFYLAVSRNNPSRCTLFCLRPYYNTEFVSSKYNSRDKYFYRFAISKKNYLRDII